jgi:hypothetical protein
VERGHDTGPLKLHLLIDGLQGGEGRGVEWGLSGLGDCGRIGGKS